MISGPLDRRGFLGRVAAALGGLAGADAALDAAEAEEFDPAEPAGSNDLMAKREDTFSREPAADYLDDEFVWDRAWPGDGHRIIEIEKPASSLPEIADGRIRLGDRVKMVAEFERDRLALARPDEKGTGQVTEIRPYREDWMDKLYFHVEVTLAPLDYTFRYPWER